MIEAWSRSTCRPPYHCPESMQQHVASPPLIRVGEVRASDYLTARPKINSHTHTQLHVNANPWSTYSQIIMGVYIKPTIPICSKWKMTTCSEAKVVISYLCVLPSFFFITLLISLLFWSIPQRCVMPIYTPG